MVLTTSLSEPWAVFFPIDSKEQKLIIPLVVTLKLYVEFHKGPFWIPYFSIYISATYFLTLSNVISQVMRTITHHIILILIQTVHQKILQVLVTEIYKVKNGIVPEIMKDIFKMQNPSYNLRSSCSEFRRENIKTVYYGLQSVRYIGPKMWELVPNTIKYSNSLSKFKKLINSWKPKTCLCIAQLGFI